MDSRVTLDSDGAIQGAAKFTLSADLESMVRAAVAGADSRQELPDRLLAGTPEGGFGTYSSSNPRDLSQPLSLVATWRSPHAVSFRNRQAYVRSRSAPMSIRRCDCASSSPVAACATTR